MLTETSGGELTRATLRILFYGPGFYKVGDYFRCRGFARALASRGHRVTLVTSSPSARFAPCWETIDGIEVIQAPHWGELRRLERLSHYMPETKVPSDIAYRTYFAASRSHRFDIVHGFHIGINGFLPLLTAGHSRQPRPIRIYDWCDLWHEGIMSQPPERGARRWDYALSSEIERRTPALGDAVTVISRYLQARAIELGAQSVLLVKDGAYIDEVKPEAKQAMRQKLGLPPNAFLLGFAGFFQPDNDLLLDALKLVRASGAQDVLLLFVGPVTERLRAELAKRRLVDAVILQGEVEHRSIGECLGACDVLLLPFSNRPVNLARWPMKLADYLAAGRPVVAGAYGDVAEFFAEHPGIGKASPGTAENFAEAILSYKGNPEALRRSGTVARSVAESVLSWSSAGARLEEFYIKLLSNR